MDERLNLLTTIARCEVMKTCLTDHSPTHPCSQVILDQWADVPSADERFERWRDEHHVPVPWVGHIETAPLLFLSSNPSLASRRKPGPPPKKQPPLARFGEHSADDHPALRQGLSVPTCEWTDAELADRFSSAFDVFMTPDGTAVLNAAGKAKKPVPYWREIKKLADHLYGRPTLPGSDYALTEVVHCQSPDEIGAPDAARVCAPRYLRRTLAISPATVIVVVGRVARQAFRREYAYADAAQVSSPMEIGGRARIVVFVAGPNAQRAKYPKTVAELDVGAVRLRLDAAGI